MPDENTERSQGDRSFVRFVEEIEDDLLRTARRLCPPGVEAEDVAAEALARAYARWDRLASADYRRAWVFRVLSNLTLSASASGRRGGLSLRRWVTREGSGRAGRMSVVETDVEMAAGLREMLRSLPPRQREAVTLHYVADLPLEETARAMGISRETAKTHIDRALATLRTDPSITTRELFDA